MLHLLLEFTNLRKSLPVLMSMLLLVIPAVHAGQRERDLEKSIRNLKMVVTVLGAATTLLVAGAVSRFVTDFGAGSFYDTEHEDWKKTLSQEELDSYYQNKRRFDRLPVSDQKNRMFKAIYRTKQQADFQQAQISALAEHQGLELNENCNRCVVNVPTTYKTLDGSNVALKDIFKKKVDQTSASSSSTTSSIYPTPHTDSMQYEKSGMK